MTRSVSLPAYAKVNLYLDVLGKREDGYHELLTLFERVSIADELTVDRGTGPETLLECDDARLPVDSSNLVIQAVEAYRRASGWTEGVRIRLKKAIPVGGGLGGGSSDAAATLQALQQLNGDLLSE